VIFDFEVFFEAQHIKKLIDEDHKIINRIKEETKIEDIFFDHEMQIPGLEGSIIRLKDNNYATKHDTLLKILDELYRTPGSTRPDVSVIILVPEGMVSLLIGSKGRQINSIMRESRTRIVVNPAIQKMTHRTVKIEGKCSYIAHACEIIYKTLENISPNVEKIEKEPKPLELDKTTMTGKLVFPKSSVGFIIGKDGIWVRDLCQKCGVSIKFQQDLSIRCVKKDEAICSISGKLAGVINAVVIMLRRYHEYESQSKHFSSDVIKLLIPNNFVTKLIGAKGCMIREIAARAGGAQIKILSDKQSEREVQDCVVAIAGSLANKQDAVCNILEQIEIFKNGGPILVNGKAINDNLALQFRNSVPLRDSGEGPEMQPEKQQNNDESKQIDQATYDEFVTEVNNDQIDEKEKDDKDASGNMIIESGQNIFNEGGNHISQEVKASRSKSPGEIGIRKPSKSRSRSRSSHRRHRHSHSKSRDGSIHKERERRRRSSSAQRDKSHGSERKDVTRNSHYIDSSGNIKITTCSIVPNYLVSYLIGKSGEVIKSIESKTGCTISFQKERHDINTAEGIRGRIVSLVGSPNVVKEAFGLLLEEIIKLEKSINGTRYEQA